MDTIAFLSSLGWYWLIAPLAAAGLGLLVVLRGIGHVFGGEAARGSLRLVIGTPLALVGMAGSLLGLNAQSYSRLTYEAPVADISVRLADAASSLYDVTVIRLDDGQPAQICRLQGDEWEIGARTQKWKPWANLLGLDTTYTLDQLTNRYLSAERGNGKAITACDLKGPPPEINQYVPKSWLFWIFEHSFVEDRRFGSAAYMPLADGARYHVVMTQSGLNAEPSNDAAKAANGVH